MVLYFGVSETNECLSSPCQNGGTCSHGVDVYTCACVDGYSGTNCQNGQHLPYYDTMKLWLTKSSSPDPHGVGLALKFMKQKISLVWFAIGNINMIGINLEND